MNDIQQQHGIMQYNNKLHASVEKPFNSCMSVRKLEHLHYSAEIVWPRNTFYQDLNKSIPE